MLQQETHHLQRLSDAMPRLCLYTVRGASASLARRSSGKPQMILYKHVLQAALQHDQNKLAKDVKAVDLGRWATVLEVARCIPGVLPSPPRVPLSHSQPIFHGRLHLQSLSIAQQNTLPSMNIPTHFRL